MKLTILTGGVTLILGIFLTGLSGCTTNNSSSITNAIAQNQAQQEIKVAGSSSTYLALQILADAYTAKVKNTKFAFLPPSQSEVTIAGVKEGLLKIGSISKRLKPEEDDGSLAYQEIALDALLVATNPSVTGITNLTTENLRAIYSGKTKNWKEFGGLDAKIVVLDRPEDESAKRLLRQYYLGQELKNSTDAVIMRKESELVAAIQTTPNSIGVFSLAYAISKKLPVNHLSLDGIAPTIENVEAKQYKMVRSLGIVWKKNSSADIKGFIDFVGSAEAARVLRESGFIASTRF